MENENNVTNNEVDVEVINESKEKSKKPIIIGVSVAVLAIIGVTVAIFFSMFSPSAKYNKANDLLEAKKYDEAIAIYKELDNYKDSKDKIDLCNFEKALLLIKEEKYVDAKNILNNLDKNEEITKKLRLCNHMILYNHIMKNGTAYKGIRYIENPDTGLNIQVRNEDKTIRVLHEYYVDSIIMSTTFAFPIESPNIEVSYFTDFGTIGEFQGEGMFYPHLYDGNLDNTSESIPEGEVGIISQSQGVELWIDDVNYSPYIDIEIDNNVEGVDEMVALQYYVDFPSNLEDLSNHLKYINCGVSISDFGIVLK